MIYSTELAILGLTIIGLGGGGHLVHRMIKHVDKRIQLMIRASYQNTRDIRENLEIVDVVRNETRKALEHQRVLLSSLNQQIRNLESTVAGEIELDNPEIVSKRVKLSEAVAKSEGLLGNLDDYLDQGIAQIVANDDSGSPKSRRFGKKQPKAISKMMKKPVDKSKAGQAVSVSNLLKQEKQRAADRDEKTQKITKLSSIFANRKGLTAAASTEDEVVETPRKLSTG